MSFTNFAGTAAAIILVTTLGAPGAYGQTAFDAAFSWAPSSACASGCSNFTINLGGTDFQFVFTSAGDGGTMNWQNGFGDNNSPSMHCLSNDLNLLSTEIITIKRSDNYPFQFTSIFIDNTAGTTLSITPYRDGSPVGTTQFATQPSRGTYNFSDILVDEIRMSATDMIGTNFDSFRGIVPAVNSPVITTSGGTTAATEQIASPIDSALVITDADSPTLLAVTVSIISGFEVSQDVLSFTNTGATMGNISGYYSAERGVLTMEGDTATLAQWQTALRSVTYTNTSDAPGTADRTISFLAYDEMVNSGVGEKTVSVTAVNDAPVLTVPASLNSPGNQPTAITGVSVSDVDADSESLSMTFSIPSGSFEATSAGGVTVMGSATNTLSLTGHVQSINYFLANNRLTYTSIAQPPSSLAMTVELNDNGNTGSGGAQTDMETVTITITTPSSVDAWTIY